MTPASVTHAVVVGPGQVATVERIAALCCGRQVVSAPPLPASPWLLSDDDLVLIVDRAVDGDEAALDAAVRGVDVILVLDGEAAPSLLDALGRTAVVLDWRSAPHALVAPTDITLLHRVGQGVALKAMASECHISERTAVRRLAAVRSQFATRSNAEASAVLLRAVAHWAERRP